MAEDNQNTEMEDILSSIKNILEEDEKKHSTAAMTDNSDVDIVNDVINSSSEGGDILELSPDMRIEEKKDDTLISNDGETADLVSEVINEKAADPLDSVDISTTDDNPFFYAPDSKPQDSTEDINLSIKGLDIGSEDFEADSFFDDSEHPQGDIQVEAAPQEDIVLPEVEAAPQEEVVLPEVEAAPQEEVVLPEVEAAPQEEVVLPEVEATPQEEVVLPEVEAAPQEEIALPEVEETTMPNLQNDISEAAPSVEAESETPDTEAVDASANIISNFAKMFSHGGISEKPQPVVEPVVATITAPGNTSTTLEEFVLSAITKVIGQEISKQWNDGADFKTFAEAEVIRQTKDWINSNLPNLVEKVVKQEIERVMAKVGSKQA